MKLFTTEEKNAYKEIMVIGVPSILETLVVTFTSIIDSKMVSSFGVVAISAISITNQPRLLVLSVFFAINTVTSSLIAKYLGEKKRDLANEIFAKTFRIVFVLSLILSIIPIIFAKQIFIFFANQADTLNDSTMYFRILMAGMIFNTIYILINAAFIGCGKTRITFISSVISSIVNIFFNYLLINGNCGFPALGVMGAAIATVIGYLAAMIYCIVSLNNSNNYVSLQYIRNNVKNSSEGSYREILALTKNNFIEKLTQRISLFIIGGIVARIGSFQMAVYSICMHLMNINYALGSGSQTAAVALVGRSYGANDANSIKLYKDCIVKLTFVVSAVLAAAIILSRNWFVGLFSKEEEFLRLGEISCIIVGYITIFQSLKFAYTGCLLGMGDMKAVMYTSVVSFSIVNIALLIILVLVLGKGLYGVWIASFASQFVQYMLARYYVNRDIKRLNVR